MNDTLKARKELDPYGEENWDDDDLEINPRLCNEFC